MCGICRARRPDPEHAQESPIRGPLRIPAATLNAFVDAAREYMWARYADAGDAAAKALVKKPAAVYVEKVHEEGDFSGLRIGT